MWDGANTGWWPLLWFTAKVWAFLFLFIWLRGTLPRLRYDQFMAIGWKVLIPVSLAWIMIVATAESLRANDRGGWATGVVIVGTLVTLLLAAALWRSLRFRAPKAVDGFLPGAIPAADTFPVPPIPTRAPTKPRETTDA